MNWFLTQAKRSLLPLALLAVTAAQANIIVDTLPAASDATLSERTGASGQWSDLAVGFTTASAGYITRITTSLYANPASYGPFYVGIASNALIGNAATPSYFAPPPGTLFEANVCSTSAGSPPVAVGCAASSAFLRSAPAFALGPNDPLDMTLSVYLPSAGTYWLYTRFSTDDTFAHWIENTSDLSNLTARRTGTCTGLSTSCNRPQDLTFFQSSTQSAMPGIRVNFDPLAVPEPETMALLAAGMTALVLRRRTMK